MAKINGGYSAFAGDGGDGSGIPVRHNSTIPPVDANDKKLFTERLHSRNKNGIFEPSEHRGQGIVHHGEVQSKEAHSNEVHNSKGKVEKSGWGNKSGHGTIIHAHGSDVK